MGGVTRKQNGLGHDRVPKRHELPVDKTWRLEDIFETEEAWETAFDDVQKAIEGANTFEGRVTESPETLLAVFQLEETIFSRLRQVVAYAMMRRDQESTDAQAQAMMQRSVTLWSRAESALAYVTPEILAEEPETIRRFVDESEALQTYAHALDDILRHKPHVLSAREEQLLAQMGDVTRGIETSFEMLNDADLTFGTIKDEKGRDVELTYARYIQFQRSPDRRVRHDAFHAFHAPYEAHKNTFAALYANSVAADIFYARSRRYDSALHAALHPDNVPKNVYDNLIETVRAHLPLLQRYFRFRQEILGVETLELYDLFVPLAPDVDVKIPYEESCQIVKEAFKPLGPEYGEALDLCFKQRWIDVYENEGKISGAYMRDVYGVHPYILMNYQGTMDDLFTLAHELGHAMHSYFTQKHQPYIYTNYSIFVAEVASIVNELLLLHHLLATETDPRRRLLLINQALDDYRGTFFHQTMFAEFEQRVHETVEQGGALTAESLSAEFKDLLHTYYGPAVRIDPKAHLGWARIPHFYSAFYVYQYATGFAAAGALAQAMIDSQESIQRYIAFLSSGGSDYPLNVLRQAGVDMKTPQPISDSLAVFADLLDELERLKG